MDATALSTLINTLLVKYNIPTEADHWRVRESGWDKVTVFTDVEPDDLLALWLLRVAQRVGLIGELTIVLTENDAATQSQKVGMVREVVPEWHRAIFRQGATSPKKRTIDAARYPPTPLEPFVWPATAPNLIVALAPVRNLLAAVADLGPAYFANTEAVAYGGFNFRTLYEGQDLEPARAMQKTVLATIAAFRRFTIAETFYALGNDSILTDVPPVVSAFTAAWNVPIREKMIANEAKARIAIDQLTSERTREEAEVARLAAIEERIVSAMDAAANASAEGDEELTQRELVHATKALKETVAKIGREEAGAKRARKVIDAIDAFPREIVCADPLVALVVLLNVAVQPGTASFDDKGYTVWDPTTPSNVRMLAHPAATQAGLADRIRDFCIALAQRVDAAAIASAAALAIAE